MGIANTLVQLAQDYLYGVVAGTATAGKAAILGDSKEINGLLPRLLVNATVAAAGSIQGDAASVLEGVTVVTGADATKGVILPTAVAGAIVIIKGTTAAVLKVYPASGAAINAIAANSAISLASLAPGMFIATSATQWYSVPLLPS